MQTADARAVVAAARAEAQRIERAVTIIVVDHAGIPVLLDREGEPGSFTAVVAEGKAVASAFVGRASGDLSQWATNLPTLVESFAMRFHGRFMAVQGAVPITSGGQVVGAIGVSGAAAEEDEQIAKAGAAAFAG
jgi:glc operon protein GlcG